MNRRVVLLVLGLAAWLTAPVCAQEPSGTAAAAGTEASGESEGAAGTEGTAGVEAAPEQPPAPKGPADLIRRANAPKPGEALPKGARAAAQPGSPHRDAQLFGAPRMASASRDTSLPVGTVRVDVRDVRGKRVSGADVQLGVMGRAEGERSTKKQRTDAEGAATFEGLATGASQAYRVNLLYDGAKISSTPFRLPDESGYRVSLSKRPVTRDASYVFQMVGQAMVELRDERFHITQQARLTNAGQDVYVFPKGGQRIQLPEGFMSFQAQRVMTDQRLTEKEGEGFVLEGSLPPGTVTLAWTYHLPRSGSEASIPLDVPWRTYMFRVLSEAPDGSSLNVRGMPKPQRVKDQGRQLWVTQVQKSPQDTPLESVVLRLEGLPGPGPGRWVAVALALLAVAFAVWAGLSPGEGDALRRKLVAQRKAELLEQVKALDAQQASGEIGPEFHAEQMEQLTSALAVVLRDEQLLEQRGEASRRGKKQAARSAA